MTFGNALRYYLPFKCIILMALPAYFGEVIKFWKITFVHHLPPDGKTNHQEVFLEMRRVKKTTSFLVHQ